MQASRNAMRLVFGLLRKRHLQGQGLVEYTAILSLVAVFVVAALMHLQPAVSTSLNTTGNTITNSSASAAWTPCGGGTCSFSGPMTVASGSGGSYTYSTVSDGATCAAGQTCYFAPLPPASPWQWASEEAYPDPLPDFTFTGTMAVAFGANDQHGTAHYLYGTFTNHASCDRGTFGGDPIYGTHKACYIMQPPS